MQSTRMALFVDSFVRSLKCVLLHIGNNYFFIPIGHSTSMKEECDSIERILKRVAYLEQQWQICVDLKTVNFLLRQKSGHTKYSCFLCVWNSRAINEHWAKRKHLDQKRPSMKEMIVGEKNIIYELLVAAENILPPCHIKHGPRKQFVKALNRDVTCFRYLCSTFSGMSLEKNYSRDF